MTRQYWANLALCIVLGVLAIFFVTQAGSALTPKGLFVSEPKPSHEAEKMLRDVVLVKTEMSEYQHANKMFGAIFSIRNKSTHSVKNVTVSCDFFDENKKFRDRDTWKLAETIPAMHQVEITSVSKRFINTNSKISMSTCSVADFQLVKKPFFTLERPLGGGHAQASGTGHETQPPAGH